MAGTSTERVSEIRSALGDATEDVIELWRSPNPTPESMRWCRRTVQRATKLVRGLGPEAHRILEIAVQEFGSIDVILGDPGFLAEAELRAENPEDMRRLKAIQTIAPIAADLERFVDALGRLDEGTIAGLMDGL